MADANCRVVFQLCVHPYDLHINKRTNLFKDIKEEVPESVKQAGAPGEESTAELVRPLN